MTDRSLSLHLRSRASWIVFFSAAAVLYLLSLRAYYVGFFNDDAAYVLIARSLLHGRYAELNAPGAPPLASYMPGYPLLLAPLVAVFGNHFLAEQLLSILFVLGTLALLGAGLRSEPPAIFWPTMLMVAFNPLVVSTSGTILSDLPYLFANVLFFVGLARLNETSPTRSWLALALLAVAAYHLRTVGAALGIVLLVDLAARKQFRLAAACAALMAAVAFPFVLRIVLLKRTGSWYAHEFADTYTSGDALRALSQNIRWQAPFYLREIFVRNFFRWPAGAPALLTPLTVILGLVLFVAGVLLRRPGRVGRGVLLYLAFYAATHLLWHRQASRYLLPVLPFIGYAFFRGLEGLRERWRWRFPPGGILAGLMLLLWISPLVNIVRTSLFLKTPVNTPAEQALQWIRSVTPPDAVFAAEMDARLYLLTNRHCLHFQKGLDRAGFLLWIRQNGVTHVLVESTAYALRTRSGDTVHDPLPASQLDSWLAAPPFQRVFASPEEGTAVYEVGKGPGFPLLISDTKDGGHAAVL